MKSKNSSEFCSQKKSRILKSYMEGLMYVEDTWDNKTSDALPVERPVMPISNIKVILPMKMSKNGKASCLSEVNVEMIEASGKVGIYVLRKLGQPILDV